MLLVLGTSAILGVGLILALPADLALRVCASLAWGTSCVRDGWVAAASFRCCDRVRLCSDGTIELHESRAGWSRAVLQDGSVVNGTFGWLRCIDEKGRQRPLIVTRRSCQSETWRRFQVLWRHLGEGH